MSPFGHDYFKAILKMVKIEGFQLKPEIRAFSIDLPLWVIPVKTGIQRSNTLAGFPPARE